MNTWPIMIVVMAVVLGVTFFRSIQKQKRALGSNKLIVSNSGITREMLNMPSITIGRAEVRESIKQNDGSFAIIGDSKRNAIGVPAVVSNIALLEQLLEGIKPLTVKTSQTWWQKYMLIISLLLVALTFIAFSADNQIISSLGGLSFGGFMIFSFFLIRRSKNIDNRVKRTSYIGLIVGILIAASVIVRLVSGS